MSKYNPGTLLKAFKALAESTAEWKTLSQAKQKFDPTEKVFFDKRKFSAEEIETLMDIILESVP